jgi:zinc protease
MIRQTRKFMIGFLAFLLLGGILAGGVRGREDELLKHPREMTFSPLSFHFPMAERMTLSNGMVVYLLEDPELPLIRLSAMVRTGSMYDPPNLSGLAKVTAKVLRNGGTADRTPQAVNEALEGMGARLEFSMEMESGSLSLVARKEDFPGALSILAGLLMNPGFDPDQVDLAKKEAIETVRRSNDNPEEIAYREFRKVLYGGNPPGREPTLESVAGIQRADLLAFYRKFFHPNNLLVGISGDFRKREMIETLEKAFYGWERALVELPYVPLPPPREGKSVQYAAKDLPVSTVLLGHLSLPLGHPDYFAFQILNFILGAGGFNSRLVREVRSNQGLAYAVGSFYRGRVGYGVFGTFCQTRSQSTHRVISLLYEIMGEMKKKPPDRRDLEWAQKAMINQFIFSFTSSAEVVRRLMKLEYEGLPEGYLERYQEAVGSVTQEDLGRAAREHLQPEKSVLLVVGKEEDFDQPLSSLGTVHRIKLEKYP